MTITRFRPGHRISCRRTRTIADEFPNRKFRGDDVAVGVGDRSERSAAADDRSKRQLPPLLEQSSGVSCRPPRLAGFFPSERRI
jgi:hypothetical protein